VTARGIELTEPARAVPPQTFYTGKYYVTKLVCCFLSHISLFIPGISVKRKRKGIIGMKINNSTKRKYT
jgi:hypothetical protein